MRQNPTRPVRTSLVRLTLLLSLLLMLQPLAGCSGENPGTAPTVRSIGESVMTAAVPAEAGPDKAASIAPVASATANPPATDLTNMTPSVGMAAGANLPIPSLSPAPSPSPSPSPSPAPSPSPSPSPAPSPKPTPKPTVQPALPYYLYCELGSFTIQVYGLDAAGAYTVPVRRMRTAIGRGSMTPRGKFRLGTRERWHTFGATAYAQYAIKYHNSGLYLHSPIYSSRNIRKMQSWSYTAIGTKNTSGCLRMTTGDIYWIYRNCPAGTVLEIVSGSPRGLKSTAPPALVRSNEDPTDPLLG